MKTTIEIPDIITFTICTDHNYVIFSITSQNPGFIEWINDTPYVDYAIGELASPNTSHGKVLYEGTCTACHGSDGRQILFDGTLGVGGIARDEPTVEILHKIRSGQPGTSMPSAIVNGWSIQDSVDVLGYIKTLPD